MTVKVRDGCSEAHIAVLLVVREKHTYIGTEV